jgi:precorrin-6Y C5,15-methyltransferase (decarboxylating)
VGGVITVVGYDGSPLGTAALAALERATLVVGGRRHLAAVPVPAGARAVALGGLVPALDELAAHDGEAVVVASGDPGFFGVVRRLRDAGLKFRVLPAVSSVALAFARAGIEWDDALVVSAHGRDLRRALNACCAQSKVAVLTAPGAGPREIGAGLRHRADVTLLVAERLGTPEERVERVTPAEAAARADWQDPNVVLVLAAAEPAPLRWVAGGAPLPAGWALPEDGFEHRDSMITKPEVRALVLARLGPRLGDLIWDVGAGSGSVAVECARFRAAVVAVERDAEQCRRIVSNAGEYDVPVRVVHGAAPDALGDIPSPDAVFVGGGGLEVLRGCAARRPSRLVTALASTERVGGAQAVLAEHGYRVDGVLLQSSRLSLLPDGTHRLAATNPVFVLWGEFS